MSAAATPGGRPLPIRWVSGSTSIGSAALELTGLSTHVIFVSRSGYSDSILIGDSVAPVQEIYGASGNVLVHLVSAYAEQTLLDKRVDIAVGQMNVENDFASSPLYCFSMNNAICGDPKALPAGDLGHSAFPDGVWAGRIRGRPTRGHLCRNRRL